jgi:hypothetical protein
MVVNGVTIDMVIAAISRRDPALVEFSPVESAD